MSRLLFIRHAQASFMKADYDQLSELGERQSILLGRYLAAEKVIFDKIYVGPLKRHQQTMEAVEKTYEAVGLPWPNPVLLQELDEHQGPEVTRHLIPRFIESDERFQKWAAEAGANPKLKQRNYFFMFNHIMRLWSRGEVDPGPTFQTWAEFRKAVSTGVEKIISDNEKGKTIVAFTSGGTKSAAVGHVLGMTDDTKIIQLNGIIQNTAITEFLFSKDRLTMKAFNALPHLSEKKMLTYV